VHDPRLLREQPEVLRAALLRRGNAEMLAILDARIQNDPDHEIREAAEQQRRITRRRLARMFLETQ